MKRTVLAAIAGGVVVLAIVGGFMALDRTVLHVYTSSDNAPPTPRPSPEADAAFNSLDVLRLALPQVTGLFFPEETEWVNCVTASYRSGNRKWVVTCEYRVNRNQPSPTTTRTYLFDDRTGQLVP